MGLGRNFQSTQIRWDGDGMDIVTHTEVVAGSGWMVSHGKAVGVSVLCNTHLDRAWHDESSPYSNTKASSRAYISSSDTYGSSCICRWSSHNLRKSLTFIRL